MCDEKNCTHNSLNNKYNTRKLLFFKVDVCDTENVCIKRFVKPLKHRKINFYDRH